MPDHIPQPSGSGPDHYEATAERLRDQFRELDQLRLHVTAMDDLPRASTVAYSLSLLHLEVQLSQVQATLALAAATAAPAEGRAAEWTAAMRSVPPARVL